MHFTSDWFSGSIPVWSRTFGILRTRASHALEIGCWEGRASVWMLQNLLIHPASTLTVIDSFEGNPGFMTCSCLGVESRFDRNVAEYADKVSKIRAPSREALRSISHRNHFNLIYIDGSHLAVDVLTDAVLSFPLLQVGGFMVFDDYGWRRRLPAHQRPQLAIDAFVSVFTEEIEVLHQGFQFILQRK